MRTFLGFIDFMRRARERNLPSSRSYWINQENKGLIEFPRTPSATNWRRFDSIEQIDKLIDDFSLKAKEYYRGH